VLYYQKKIYKRDDFISEINSFDGSGFEFTLQNKNNISEECLNAIYSNCELDTDFDSTSMDNICDNFSKKKTCGAFLNEPENKFFGNIQGCRNEDPKVLTDFYNEYVELYELINNMCISDESGKLCPHLEYFTLNNFYFDHPDLTEEIIMKYADASCYSKICTDNLIEGYESYVNTHDEGDEAKNNEYFEKAIKHLKSKECKSKSTTSSNDASTIKYTSSLLVTFTVLFFTLF